MNVNDQRSTIVLEYHRIVFWKRAVIGCGRFSPSPSEKSGVVCLDSCELYPRSLISTGGRKTPTGHRDSAFSGLMYTGILLFVEPRRCPGKNTIRNSFDTTFSRSRLSESKYSTKLPRISRCASSSYGDVGSLVDRSISCAIRINFTIG